MTIAALRTNVRDMSNPVHDRIRERLADLQLRPGPASVKSGLSRDFLRTLFSREDAMPRAQNLTKLAQGLETTEEWLMHGRGAKADQSARQQNVSPPDLAEVVPQTAISLDVLRSQMPQDLPVYAGGASGSVVVDERGGFEMEFRVVEYVRRPPALASVPDAYAIYITGTSMHPEHKDGDLRFVHPHRPSRPGDSVVLQCDFHDGHNVKAYIGNLVRRSASKIVVQKLYPETIELEFDPAHVTAIHRVLTTGELFGI